MKHISLAALVFTCCLLAAAAGAAPLELKEATVITPGDASVIEQNAARMLIEETEKRTGTQWTLAHEMPGEAKPVVIVGTVDKLRGLLGAHADAMLGEKPQGTEGFVLRSFEGHGAPAIVIAANDPRGVMFGAGRLLRELRMRKGSATLPGPLALNTAPQVAMRGHQLGYRPKVNTYDGWTLAMFEQYFRDLIVFGTNSIEMMPPRTDDAPDSPHFVMPQLEMMAKQSKIAHEYGLAVWIWYPALDKDYSDQKTVDAALQEWGAVFDAIPYIDAVLVPGGDPGHTPPRLMINLLEKETEVLHRSHPQAQMWMTPQGFTLEWQEAFLKIMQEEQPAWLTGIAFGPQNRLSLPDLRKAIPAKYPIRHYPDITHSYCCQYPVQDWDVAYQLTEDREVINPRPEAFAKIFRWALPYAPDFISYSEGCNDDLNKMLWSALGWDPKMDEHAFVREYARYFIGADYEYDFANLLCALEKNWEGALLTNSGVETTLLQAQAIDKAASPQTRLNWRFQQALYRAYFDAYTRRRLIYETELEARATDLLRKAPELGAPLAIEQAEAVLNRALLEPVGQELRGRVSDMAEALYQSVRMQLSVPRFQAIDAGRGANFDLIDTPLNNRKWLASRFAEIKRMDTADAQQAALREITEWTNPGPGGFYDDLGTPGQQPHLVREMTAEFDPENRSNPLLGYENEPVDRRMSWFVDAETRFETPLVMQYAGLDPNAQYKVRVVYAGDKFDTEMRLVANDTLEVHPLQKKAFPIRPVEFDIPQAATASGSLKLSWTQTPGRGSAGRGCQVAEVWLMKK